MQANIYTPFNIGDKVTCCVYGDGIIIDKQRHNGRDCWFDGDSWLQIFMPNYPYGKIYFDISGRCAEEGDWLVNSPTLFYKKQHPIIKQFNEKQYSGLKYDVLNTQELLLSIFNLSQSFVFFLDVDDFFVEPIYLTIDKNANWIETQYVPDKPLMGYQGEVLDYHWKYGWDNHYLLLLQKHNYEKMIATTTPDLINLSKQLDPNKPFIKQKPYYLHFGIDID